MGSEHRFTNPTESTHMRGKLETILVKSYIQESQSKSLQYTMCPCLLAWREDFTPFSISLSNPHSPAAGNRKSNLMF